MNPMTTKYPDLAYFAQNLADKLFSEAGAINSTEGLWEYIYAPLQAERDRAVRAEDAESRLRYPDTTGQ